MGQVDLQPASWISRVLLALSGMVLVLAGGAWIALNLANISEFQNAGGALGAVTLGGLPGLTGIGTGLFLIRLAAARFPGSL